MKFQDLMVKIQSVSFMLTVLVVSKGENIKRVYKKSIKSIKSIWRAKGWARERDGMVRDRSEGKRKVEWHKSVSWLEDGWEVGWEWEVGWKLEVEWEWEVGWKLEVG